MLAPGTAGSEGIPDAGSSMMVGILSLWVVGSDSIFFLSKPVREMNL